MNEDGFKKLSDEIKKDDIDYCIPNEAVCSAEFSNGCILFEE